jgi:hypothetical protein
MLKTLHLDLHLLWMGDRWCIRTDGTLAIVFLCVFRFYFTRTGLLLSRVTCSCWGTAFWVALPVCFLPPSLFFLIVLVN